MLATLAVLLALTQDAAPVRASVERSLPYLEKEGAAWIANRACLSCHHVPFLLWSFREVQAKGIAIDATKLDGWTEWARKESTKQREKVTLSKAGLEALGGEGVPAATLAKLAAFPEKFRADKEEVFLRELAKLLTPEEFAGHRERLLKQATRTKGDGGGLDSMVQLLLGGSYASDDGFVAATRGRILELQQADGSWKPGGQLFGTNRSASEATQLTTMLAALAVPESADALARARAYLRTASTGKVLEGLAVRLLLSARLGDAESAQAAAKELVARQNPDGGWASLQGAASDAFATGQALYALAVAGGAGAGDAIERGRKQLVETQNPDGSWTVPPSAVTSPKRPPERLKSLDPIYRYWGSAWATIGLAATLPAQRRDDHQ